MATEMSSRDFNQDTGRAKKAAASGPVYITDRGRPAHVLLTFEAYEELLSPTSILDVLAEPSGVADFTFDAPADRRAPTPAAFD